MRAEALTGRVRGQLVRNLTKRRCVRLVVEAGYDAMAWIGGVLLAGRATGGITAITLPNYLAVPQVAAVGGSWMAERKLVAEKNWAKVSALAAEALAATRK